MNFNSSLKKLICFLLAVLMLLTTAGCVKTVKRKKKKKVVVTEEVIVKNDKDDSNNDDVIIVDDEKDDEADEKITLPDRPLPEEKVSNTVKKYEEKFEPEFEYKYVDWAGPEGYTVVYSHKETNNRVPAANLITFFKDKYNVNLGLPVKDNTNEAKNATKRILVGDTLFKSSAVSDKNYSVTLLENGDLFFDGAHFSLVESAEEWFETVEVKEGKVATLTGTNKEFASTIKVGDKTYNYVWGDEFDGDALIDSEKWTQGSFVIDPDMAQVHNDRKFNSVENGRLRMTADLHYDETDPKVNYGMSGSTRTSNTMAFRNGYIEVRARLPYDKGAFPAIWTMSSGMSSTLEKSIPNYDVNDGYGIYKNRIWDLEFDLFESFSDEDKFTTSLHKWYRNADNKSNEIYFNIYDAATNTLNKVNVTDKMQFNYTKPDSAGQFYSSHSWAYPGSPSSQWLNKVYDEEYYCYYFGEEAQKTINQEYHTYSYHYTGNHCTVYFDGEKFLDWDFDPNFDYKDLDGDGKPDDVSNNNNGVGFNLWHYLIFDMMIYSPIRAYDETYMANNPARKRDPEDVVDPSVMPHNMYIDYIRIYQDPTDASQAICFPAGQD